MNELTEKILTQMKAVAALIVYQDDKDNQHIELRPIDDEGKMKEAMPVTYEFMNDLTATYCASNDGMPYGEIPDNLLYANTHAGSQCYIWYTLPGKQQLFFQSTLNIPNGEYQLPGIIFIADKTVLKVFSFMGNKKPSSETELYLGPFFNVSRTGVCLGSAKLKKPLDLTYQKLIEYWEKMFWLTEFSHLGENPVNGNLVLLTKEAKDKPFDTSTLKPLKKKLKDLIK